MQNAIVGVCATRSEGKQIYHVSRDFIPARFFSFLEVVRVVDIPVVSLGQSRRRERHRKCQKPWRKETFASMV